MPTLKARFTAAIKALRFPGMATNVWFGGYGGHGVAAWGGAGAFANMATNPADNSIVAATIGWIGRTFPEAPIRVMRETAKGEEVVAAHPLALKLKRPNPFYSGAQMWTPLMMSYLLDGNAYLLKERTNGGDVLNLWYVPHWMIEPRWPADGSVFISHYEYRVDNQVIRYPVADVVHLPNGRDPHNMRKGQSPLKSALREIYTDNEITEYESWMVTNRGTPGMVISPGSPDQELTPEQVVAIKQDVKEKTTGTRRGEPLVSLGAIKVDTPAFSPADMNLRQMRWTPEERISALIGIPAIVIGLGAGLEHATFANYQQAREAAYESFLMPVQALIDEELTTQLLPDFDDDASLRVAHDYGEVRVLQPDADALSARIEHLFASGIIDRATAKRELKFDVLPEDEGIYFLPRGGSFSDGAIAEPVSPVTVQEDTDPAANAAPTAPTAPTAPPAAPTAPTAPPTKE